MNYWENPKGIVFFFFFFRKKGAIHGGWSQKANITKQKNKAFCVCNKMQLEEMGVELVVVLMADVAGLRVNSLRTLLKV